MSCGCGSGHVPASVKLRMEAARLALSVGSKDATTRMQEIYDFITTGVDVAKLDTPPTPIATGEGPDAVVSRNAFINGPITRAAALNRRAVAEATAGGLGVLGTLVQATPTDVAQRTCASTCDELRDGLAKYGLRLGMTADDLREWVLRGVA